MPPRLGHPDLGLGVGLRTVHFSHILREWPAIGLVRSHLRKLYRFAGPSAVRPRTDRRALTPSSCTAFRFRSASTDPLDFEYLGKLAKLAREVNARWVSDHLCWTGVAGRNTARPSARPLERRDAGACDRARPHRAEFSRTAARSRKPQQLCDVADFGRCPNGSFSRGWRKRPIAGLLLDVNNVYVSRRPIMTSTRSSTLNRFCRTNGSCSITLAGHTDCGTHCIDTHDGHVVDPVWEALCPRARAHRPLFRRCSNGTRNIPEFLCSSRRSQESKTVLAPIHRCTRQR